MTLAATTVDNRSNTTAHGDMRVFASTVRNTGEGAALHSNNNLWIQKDAQGNKATLVENRSARIQTNSGDLVIRTNELSNVRDVLTIATQSEAVDTEGMRIYGVLFNAHKNGDIKNRQDLYQEDYAKREKWMLPCNSVEECTYVTRNIDRWIPDERTRNFIKMSTSEAVIDSGKNSFINADSLKNNASTLKAKGDMILTGKMFVSTNHSVGIKERFNKFIPDTEAYKQYDNLGWPYPPISYLDSGEKGYSWVPQNYLSSKVIAGGNFVADFSERIENSEPYKTSVQYSDVMSRPDTITAKNILLHAGSIITTDVMKATGDITLQSNTFTKVALALLTAGKDISILAGANIDSWQSELKGQNITLVSRNGDVNSHTSEQPNYFHADGVRWLGSIEASKDLSISAGGNILLRNTRLPVQSQ
ncbi:MAG: filamentous hemagglutinin, partial [Hafnia alvei]|nr:filamentous hemagglutinin [Hafnia alvei]